ncbi:hypothetical protein F5878DRAFT_666203 [Lentinula raphanica]|uniref:Uncharacterized protein n=1 Tax=Lentinula raphanica TaxID=153919 RepID=A0AA38NYA7_9AGAR|nr:hypothetical protein F5878DRAFT_666203 [Lentinula raphanica]
MFSSYASIQYLPDDQRFNGENFVSFKEIILPTGRLRGLDLYWEGRVTNPHNTPSPYIAPTNPAAVNDPNLTQLEYDLRESVAYLTLWSNIKNPDGLGIPRGLSSHALWDYLRMEFLQVATIARQRKEDNL